MAVDLTLPIEPIDSIEEGIVAALSPLAVLESVESEEVEKLAALPAATLLFSFPGQDESQTGGITDNTWRWVLSLYFNGKDWSRAQREHKRAIVDVLVALRADPTFGFACDRSEVRDGGRPLFDRDKGILIKRLEITAYTEEE